MKHRQNSSVRISLYILGLLSAFFGGSVSAQYMPKKDDPQCELGDLRFQYPSYFALEKVKGEENKAALFKYKDGQERLFVTLLTSPANLKQEVEKIRDRIVAEVFPNEAEKFNWKKVEGVFWGYSGEHDDVQEKWQGFNDRKRFFLEYHLLKYKKKDILVGYAFAPESESAASAKASFDDNLDAWSGPAGAGCSTIIASITKEKDITVGMPPPAMAPPKKKN